MAARSKNPNQNAYSELPDIHMNTAKGMTIGVPDVRMATAKGLTLDKDIRMETACSRTQELHQLTRLISVRERHTGLRAGYSERQRIIGMSITMATVSQVDEPDRLI